MSAPLPSAGQAAYVYKPVPSSFHDGYGDIGPQATAIPVAPPAPVYYGTWRDDMGQVEVVHRADDWDLVCSLCIVFSFFFAFVVLIVVLSIEYDDDDYSRRRLLDIVLGKITDQF